MQWSEVIEDPSLQNLPYKIETNRFGKIVMSPASRRHSRYQGIIVGLLYAMKSSGEVYPECPIETPDGVKVPDAAWASNAFLALVDDDELTFKQAPELCVEVLSVSNSFVEIEQKKSIYFQQGAHEVWIADLQGSVKFFDATGEIDRSRLFPEFPSQV